MEEKRTLLFKIECDNSDFAEHQLRQAMKAFSPSYVKTLPRVAHLKDNSTYKSLVKSKQQAQKSLDSFIDRNRR